MLTVPTLALCLFGVPVRGQQGLTQGYSNSVQGTGNGQWWVLALVPSRKILTNFKIFLFLKVALLLQGLCSFSKLLLVQTFSGNNSFKLVKGISVSNLPDCQQGPPWDACPQGQQRGRSASPICGLYPDYDSQAWVGIQMTSGSRRWCQWTWGTSWSLELHGRLHKCTT